MSDFTAVITVSAAAADSLSTVGAGLNYMKKEDKAHWSDYLQALAFSPAQMLNRPFISGSSVLKIT